MHVGFASGQVIHRKLYEWTDGLPMNNKGPSFQQKIRQTSDKKYVVNDGVVEGFRER
jgi:hypothetical protein